VTSELFLGLAVEKDQTAQPERKVTIADGVRLLLGSATPIWVSQSAPSVAR
jgi:hypothetical protein